MRREHVRAARVHEPGPEVASFAAGYWDRFRIAQPAQEAAPGVWGRLALGGAASANGAFGRLVWGALLGFELADRGVPGTFVGWRIVRDDEDAFVIDADGSLMAGRLLFARAGRELEWTTMLRFHGRAGALVWSFAGHAHRALAPRCLEHASAKLAKR